MKIPERPTAAEAMFNQGREGFYGWGGLGGSIFVWHPELKIGFAFIPTKLLIFDIINARCGVLQKILLDCVKKNQK